MEEVGQISILLNGEHREVLSSFSLLDLLEHFHITPQVVALTLNTKIIKKEQWDSEKLSEGDCVECLTFMGGG